MHRRADSLLSALDAKSKAAYRSRAQAALHMLNNAAFLAAAAGGRELKAVGEAWLEAHKVRLVGRTCVHVGNGEGGSACVSGHGAGLF